jgi:hypothetical protein
MFGPPGEVSDKTHDAILQTAGKVLQTIFGLEGIQRVQGAGGKMDRFTTRFDGKDQLFYVDNKGQVSAFPAHLQVQVRSQVLLDDRYSMLTLCDVTVEGLNVNVTNI